MVTARNMHYVCQLLVQILWVRCGYIQSLFICDKNTGQRGWITALTAHLQI